MMKKLIFKTVIVFLAIGGAFLSDAILLRVILLQFQNGSNILEAIHRTP